MAYVALHRAGPMNDNLLLTVKEFGPEPGREHRDQPSIVTVSERLDSWRVIAKHASLDATPWSATEITLIKHGATVASMVPCLPTALPCDLDFDLYWNAIETYRVSVKA